MAEQPGERTERPRLSPIDRLAQTQTGLEASLDAYEELPHTELSLRACANLENQCFGAVGSRCGGTPSSWSVDIPPFVQLGCRGDRCWTNAGSWEHDECCFRNKGGVACNLPHADDGSGTALLAAVAP